MATRTEDADAIVYNHAMFLVQVFPDDAVDMLRQINSGRPDSKVTSVETQARFLFPKLRGLSQNKIQVMIEDQDWDGLRASLPSASQAQMTPRGYSSREIMPPTPSTTASGSSQSHRHRDPCLITVFHNGETCPLTAKPSGSREYIIGEDKLDRFAGIKVVRSDSPSDLEIGGRWIPVQESVSLTWNQAGDQSTNHDYFWIVSSEHIRNADVLLGYKKKPAHGRRNHGPVHSPLTLNAQPEDSQNRMPPAPTAPPAVPSDFFQNRQSSTAIYTGSPPPKYGRAGAPSESEVTVHHAPRSSARTASSVFNTATSSMGNPPMERSPSRPQSASSATTAKPPSVDTVMIQLSFEGKGKRLLPLDLTKTGDEIMPWLDPHVFKLTGGRSIDRHNHELTVTHQGKDDDPLSLSLSEDIFDDCWESVIDFIVENRATTGTKKPEFRFDIG